MKHIKLLIILLLISQKIILAQTGTVRGFVYDKSNGEPIIFTNVYLKGTTYGVATDVNGYYSISKVKEGKYFLTVSYVGYDLLSIPITITKDKILTKKLYLVKLSIKLDEFTVTAEKQEKQKAIYASIVKITPKQIEKIPSMGSEPDLAQYLQVVPGVIFTGDQGGQLYIRGGSPIQNKVLLDGMIVYNPFHSIGLFSVFDSDIIRNADIFTGGFGAEYGGRISSIMNITTRDGNKQRISGKISSNPFGSKLLLEGPINKATENGGSSSYLFSAKTSYLEQTSKSLYRYANEDGLPFNYNDFYGKVSINSQNGSKVSFFGFNFSDRVNNYKLLSNLNWSETGAGTSIILIPSNSSVLIKTNFAYSRYFIELNSQDQTPRNSLINGYNLGLSFIYYFGDDKLDYGIETLGFKTNFEYTNSLDREIYQEENTTELAGYVTYKHSFGKLLIEPSFRLQYYASLSEISPEPRLGMKYKINDDLRLKFAGGFYSQNLIASNSDRDVVNLFSGFLSGTSNIQNEFDGNPIKTKLQKSQHLIFGVEYDITNRLNVNIEGYFKNNSQLTNLNRNKIFDDVYSNYEIPDCLKKDFIVETGDAYGVDFLIKYDYKRVFLWLVYSLGYVDRNAEVVGENKQVIIEKYSPHFDRRHNVNFISSYTFGKDLNWEFSARWNIGSGFPFTQTSGFYEFVPFTDINTDYTTANGNLGIIYSNINEGRLPYYHRLDVALKHKFEISDNTTLETSLSITNVYNRNNIFYFDRIKHERVDQLPFLPSFGLSLKF